MGFPAPSFPKIELPQVESAYLAGIFDGEGSVSIIRMNRGSPKISFNVVIHVTNTDLDLLEWICQKLGGAIYGAWGTKKVCKRWQMGGYKIRPVLEVLLPYLRVKREQAELALKFLDLGNTWCWEDRAKMYAEMKGLNGSSRPVRLEAETHS